MTKTEYENLEEKLLQAAFCNVDGSRKEYSEYCIKYLGATREQLRLLWKFKYLYVNGWGLVRTTRKGTDRFYELRDME